MSTPTGMITAFGGPLSKVPNDWIPCDGKLYDRTNKLYTPLFDAIGDSWGGDGANMFAAPDLRGRFLRGVANGTTTDPDAASRTAPRPDLNASGNARDAVGSMQPCEVQKHHHFIGSPSGVNGPNGGGANYMLEAQNRPTPTQTEDVGGSETRPVNAYVHYIIKL